MVKLKTIRYWTQLSNDHCFAAMAAREVGNARRHRVEITKMRYAQRRVLRLMRGT